MKSERGFSLIEVLVSLMILAMIGLAFLSALATSSRATLIMDERTTAKNLACSQMEYTKRYLYDKDAVTYPYVYDEIYNPDPIALPEGYDISIVVSPIPEGDANIQKITVTIKRGDREITTLEAYKVNR